MLLYSPDVSVENDFRCSSSWSALSRAEAASVMIFRRSIQTLELPTDKKNIHLRKPAKPIDEVRQIYQATGCTDTQKAVKKYVVYH